MVVGTAIGTKGAILPLIFGTVPFFTRQIESALAEVDYGLIEAAESMGDSPWQIIFRVYLKESVPGIVRAMQITFISLVGLTAMAGAVGGGGSEISQSATVIPEDRQMSRMRQLSSS